MPRFQIDVPSSAKKQEKSKFEGEHALPGLMEELKSDDPKDRQRAINEIIRQYKKGDPVYEENAAELINALTKAQETGEKVGPVQEIMNDLEPIAKKQRKEQEPAAPEAKEEVSLGARQIESLKSQFAAIQNIDMKDPKKILDIDGSDLAAYAAQLENLAANSDLYEDPDFQSTMWSELAYLDRLNSSYFNAVSSALRKKEIIGNEASEKRADLNLVSQSMENFKKLTDLVKNRGRGETATEAAA